MQVTSTVTPGMPIIEPKVFGDACDVLCKRLTAGTFAQAASHHRQYTRANRFPLDRPVHLDLQYQGKRVRFIYWGSINQFIDYRTYIQFATDYYYIRFNIVECTLIYEQINNTETCRLAFVEEFT